MNESVSKPLLPATVDDTGRTQTYIPLGVPVSAAQAANRAGVPSIPGHEILGEIGEGGMGLVYKARHVRLDRLVALKVIRPDRPLSADEEARFRTEAESIARLQHPHIVQIHEVGEWQPPAGGRPLPYLALEFCEGGSLAKKLGGQPLPPREAAEVVETLTRAVQAAHDKNLIHRDLKPANVLLDADGRLKITDFGLAKKLDDAGQTRTGAVMGTPSYMAPEQAAGQTAQIGKAADVYALGAILYELLTGRPPFRAATVLATLQQVLHEEPVPPAHLQPGTPRDLETICLKCLHKEPSNRYSNAATLGRDLRNWLEGKPIEARRAGRVERGVKWVRRNPVVTALLAASAGLLVALVLAVTGGLVGFIVKYLDAEHKKTLLAQAEVTKAIDESKLKDEKRIAVEEKNEELRKENREKAEQLAISNILHAQAAWENNDVMLGRELLERVPTEPFPLRRWEWHYLRRKFEGGIFTLYGHLGPVTSVAFSPDGSRLATASLDGTARLWDARTGISLFEIKEHTTSVQCVVFSPDGRRLATASGHRVNGENTGRVWDARTGKQLLELNGHKGLVQCIAFHPDGTRLATASWDSTARLWDARTGESLLEIKGHSRKVHSVAFSPDGSRLATVSEDETARVWDVRTGNQLFVVQGMGRSGPERMTTVAFSPDGACLATASELEETVWLWDARSGAKLREFQGRSRLRSLTFSPDGTQVATASDDGTAQIWDARTGKQVIEFKGHTGIVLGVAFSPDGTRLATASGDTTVRLWDARTGHPRLELQAEGMVFSPDGTRLAGPGLNNTGQLWDARTGQLLVELKGHADRVCHMAFSPDGSRVATASLDRTARLWDAQTGNPKLELKGHTSVVKCVAFNPDGTRLATACGDGTARVWDTRTSEQLLDIKGPKGQVNSVAFSPDGTRLATAADNSTRLWNAHTGEPLLELLGKYSSGNCVAFSPDGTRLAVSRLGGACLWDAHTGDLLLELRAASPRSVYVGKSTRGDWRANLAFSPDGSRLAVNDGNTVRLCDTRTGVQVLEIGEYEGLGVAFSSDGKRLAVGNRLWNTNTGNLFRDLGLHAGRAEGIFNLEGTQLTTRDSAGKTVVWDVVTGQPLPNATPAPPSPKPEGEAWLNARSSDGRWLAVLFGRTVRMVDLKQCPDEEEAGCRRWATSTDPEWHKRQLSDFGSIRRDLSVKDWYAALYHRNRLRESGVPRTSDPRLILSLAVSRDPKNYAARVARVRLFLEGGETSGYPGVCATLAALAADGKDDALTRQLAATCVLAPNALPDLKPLLAAFDKTLTGPKKYPEDLRIQGGLLLRAGQPEEAVKRLIEAKQDQDETPYEDLLLALAYQQLKRPDDAKQALTRATAALDRTRHGLAAGNALLSGNVSPLHALTGLQAPQLPDWRERMLGWQGWLDLQILRREAEGVQPKTTPVDAEAHYRLGVSLQGVGKLPEAEAALRESLRLKPSNTAAHYSLGFCLGAQGRDAEAAASYRKVIEQNANYAEAHCNLGNMLRLQGELVESLAEYRKGHELGSKRPNWTYPSAQWVTSAERFVELEKQLPKIVDGTLKPANSTEQIQFAQLCLYKRRVTAATRLYAATFRTTPGLAGQTALGHRFLAACAAGLAGFGEGEDVATLTDKERADLRRQALDWLRADLALWKKQADSDKPTERATVRRTLYRWQTDVRLVPLHDKEKLTKLSEEEQKQWRQLWADVEAVLAKVRDTEK